MLAQSYPVTSARIRNMICNVGKVSPSANHMQGIPFIDVGHNLINYFYKNRGPIKSQILHVKHDIQTRIKQRRDKLNNSDLNIPKTQRC